MTLSIAPVRGKEDLEDFLRIPYDIYADDPHYVFPLLAEQHRFLDREHNPFFRHAETCLWVARRNGKPVGRIAACVDHYHNEAHLEQTGFFGFYEAPPAADAAEALLQAAAAWLTEHGMTVMRGPCCFTTNHDFLGLFLEGEASPPVVGMPYNPDYYAEQLADFGLSKSKDLWAWKMAPESTVIPEKIQRIIDKLLRSDAFTVRPFDMKRFAEEAKTVRMIYNAAWGKNWGFIPMDDEEFAYAAKDMKKMVNPQLLLIAEAQERPIGFSLTVPDFNIALKPCRGSLYPFGFLKFLWHKRKIHYARTLLMGVLPEFRHRGVDVVMVYKTFQAGYRLGYHTGECSWVLEDNVAMNRVLEGIGARVYKTYRIYDKPLP
jgi:hypothetical protein